MLRKRIAGRAAACCATGLVVLTVLAAPSLMLEASSAVAKAPTTLAAQSPLPAAAASGTCYYQVTGTNQIPIRNNPNSEGSIVGYIPGRAYFFASCNLTNGNWYFTDDPNTYALGYVYDGNVTLISHPTVALSARR